MHTYLMLKSASKTRIKGTCHALHFPSLHSNSDCQYQIIYLEILHTLNMYDNVTDNYDYMGIVGPGRSL